MDTTPDQAPIDPAEDPVQETPAADIIRFPAPIIPNANKLGTMEAISEVEYLREENGHHVFRLPDGRVTAAPASGGDRAQNIADWISAP